MDKVSVVVVAAGRSTRMGGIGSKPYITIGDRPVLGHSLLVFEVSPLVSEIVVVTEQTEIARCRSEVVERYGFKKVKNIVAGGSVRQESVWQGLLKISPESGFVAVHDGARPLLTVGLLEEVVRCAIQFGSAVTAVPVKDTIKTADADGFVLDTPDRQRLWAMQTPQVFRYDLLMDAYRRAFSEGIVGTDDAMLMEHSGHPVKLCMGSYENIKVTTPEDLDLAELVLRRRSECGLG